MDYIGVQALVITYPCTCTNTAPGNPAVWRRKQEEEDGARMAGVRHHERPSFADLDEFETRFAESKSNRPHTRGLESGSEPC